MNKHVLLLVAVLLLASVLSSGAARDLDVDPKRVPSGPDPVGPPAPAPPKGMVPASGFPGAGGFGMPSGRGYGIPGWSGGNGFPGFPGGGWGAGYGGPSGGYATGGVVRPSVVCREKGPCYKKKLTCPAKCFTSYSRSGKNYGAGGGGGGCTIDCKKRCVAYC